MTSRNPLWTQGGTTSAEEDRALIAAHYASQGSGIIGISGADLKVAQHGTPNMSVDVAPGRVAIAGTESPTLQGVYIGWLDATANVVIAASDPTNPRIDLIVARIKDAQYSGATNSFSIEAVTGTPAGSPVAPAAPANSFILAQVAVAALATTVVTGNITDSRVWTGSKPWSLPWGEVAHAETSTNTSTISAVTDVAGASAVWTAIANRKLKITASCRLTKSATPGDVILFVTDGSGTVKWQRRMSLAASETRTVEYTYRETGIAAGSTTRKLRVQSLTSTVDATEDAVGHNFIHVDDIGPNGNPA